ncbi:lanosterol 14-alpha-demethylase [Infundibulicybe gibba]|nr:lanosterol 14-alpha-demethylase [Infundibulicybe gibba]
MARWFDFCLQLDTELKSRDLSPAPLEYYLAWKILMFPVDIEQIHPEWSTPAPVSSQLLFLAFVALPAGLVALNICHQFLRPDHPSKPPVVFHWLPFIGSAIEYGKDPLKFYFACREKYGDVFTFILFGRRVTVALGAKGNDFILGGKSTIFNAEQVYSPLTTPVFGKDVIFDVPNEKFMEQKKFVKAGLSTDNLRAYVGMIEDEVNQFLASDPQFSASDQDASGWGSFDVAKVLAEITILTASRTLQGSEVRNSLDKTFSQLYTDLDGGFTPLNLLFSNLPLESYRKRDRAHQQMSNFYIDIIKKRRETGAIGDDQHDMIGTFMQQCYRDGTPLRDHEIAHLMITLLMAGQHTSSSSGSWTLLHIAHNPEIADALYQEQIKNFGTPDGKLRPMTCAELRALPLLDAVIRETLRMHPPIHSIMRKVLEDVIVPASLSAPSEDKMYVVPKGHLVFACPAFSQVDPRVWKNALQWVPERWSDPNGIAIQASNMDKNGEKVDYGFGAVSKGTESPYQPFGAENIGFAYLQLGTIVATFIRRMELRIERIPEHNYHTLIVMPKDPRIVRWKRRYSNA